MEYNIRNVCKEKRMSQEELAQKSGVSRTTISTLEAGIERITTATLVKLTAALGGDGRPAFLQRMFHLLNDKRRGRR